jgi:hypothetical protein
MAYYYRMKTAENGGSGVGQFGTFQAGKALSPI